MTFDDLSYARAIMADRDREAANERLAKLARAARAAATCCERADREGRLAAIRRRLSFAPTPAECAC